MGPCHKSRRATGAFFWSTIGSRQARMETESLLEPDPLCASLRGDGIVDQRTHLNPRLAGAR